MSGLIIAALSIPALPIAQPVQGTNSVPTGLTVTLDPNGDPQFITQKPKPDYDTEVLKPLRAAQAKAEADRKAKIASDCKDAGGTLDGETCNVPKPIVTSVKQAPVTSGGTSGAWQLLRNCESGGNYADNTGNGFYGAYQFDLQTWANFGGYSRPSDAPPAVQDAKAAATQAARGWSPWPACSAKLGLSSGGQ